MMTTFFKKLSWNLFTVLATIGMVYSFAVVGKHWFGSELYGFIALITGMLILWILERSYKDAKREHNEV